MKKTLFAQHYSYTTKYPTNYQFHHTTFTLNTAKNYVGPTTTNRSVNSLSISE